ncbi:MAG: 4a-hydroxytetrahydrobiopterin dehydratase [Candidatus Nomurabacteria bacterium]|nr:MAG: 4a-hydroxytetrahydrobiopterin dehydratase [Candidatus Nomurabacteria bacterium]
MSELLAKKCVPCEGGIPPATDEEIAQLLPQLSNWEVKVIEKNGVEMKTLQKRFTFDDFRAAMAFLRKVEGLAESEGHHPDFCVHYNKVDFTLFTHAIRGLHENDFILAVKIDRL